MKVLFFDLRESEKAFFEKNSYSDFEIIFRIDSYTKLHKCLADVGKISLELYVVHWLLMFWHIVKTDSVDCNQISGFCFCIMHYVLFLLASIIIIKLLKTNPVSDLVLFGKMPKIKRNKEMVEH